MDVSTVDLGPLGCTFPFGKEWRVTDHSEPDVSLLEIDTALTSKDLLYDGTCDTLLPEKVGETALV